MSGHTSLSARELLTRVAALVAIVAMAVLVGRYSASAPTFAPTIAALGLLLLGGDLLSVIVGKFGLPHLTGYLLAGLIMGPYGLHAITEHSVEQLSLVNALALALIALSAGSELTLSLLRSGLKSLTAASLTQTLIALPVVTLAFFALRGFIPFVEALQVSAAFGVALIWGVVAVCHSPAAVLAVIAQVKPAGPLTRYALTFIVSYDIFVLVLFAVILQIGKSLLVGGAGVELSSLSAVGYQLAASVTFGITLGLIIAAYFTFVKRAAILFVVALSYAVTLTAQMLGYDAMLLFVVAGFVVANTSSVGDALMEGVAKGGRLVYVLFFAVAGAHVNVPLLAKLWPVALMLTGARILAMWMASRAGAAIANDVEAVKRYGWMPCISQAGVTIGLSVVIAQALPGIGSDIQALIIAVVGLNEMVGPVLFKLALDKSGESGKGAEQFAQEEGAL